MGRAVLTSQDWIRDPGFFPGEPNPFYIMRDVPDYGMFFNEPVWRDVIKLIIEIRDRPISYSEVRPVKAPPFDNPRRDGDKVELYDPDYPFRITWTSLEHYQEIYLEMHYKDWYEDRTVPRTIIWREYHSLPPPDRKNPVKNIVITGAQMMQRIAANIREDTAVMARTFEKMVARLHFTDDRVYTYNLIYSVVQDDRAGAGYSDIVNGLGLFGATAKNQRWFTFSFRTADSLAKGQYTKHLRFRND
jgi:hypothetical protein